MTEETEKDLEESSSKNFYGDKALQWWRELNGKLEKYKEDRATLAKLRRCKELNDAYFVEATFYLYHQLRKPEWMKNDNLWRTRVAILAILLAHVKGNKSSGKKGLMAPVGRKELKDKDNVKLSEGRFRRLLQVETPDEILSAFRRLIKFMPEEVDIKKLTGAILFWNDNTKCNLAFSYYGVANTDPSDNQNTSKTAA